MFGIGTLRWYVIDQVLRAFILALLTLTTIFVLIIVMTESSREGLTPQDIARIVPFLVPGSLPYTLPVSLLFAVTIVYGRMASDNEIIAIKAAGQSAMRVIHPILGLSLVLSAGLWISSSELIPRANAQFKAILYSSLEDLFYKMLKKERQFDRADWPFFIRVKDVEDRILIDPIFKHRSRQSPKSYDLEVTAKRASIRFLRDGDRPSVRVVLEDSETYGGNEQPFRFMIHGRKVIDYPLPNQSDDAPQARVQELTDGQIEETILDLRRKLVVERKRQAMAATLWMTSGRIQRVDWPHIRRAFVDQADWRRRIDQLSTERELRRALAVCPFFFVLLGAPVGILMARRDFLSAFITCFIPIILLYYPLTLAGVNLGKESLTPPWAVFGGDLLLGLIAVLFVLPPVKRH